MLLLKKCIVDAVGTYKSYPNSTNLKYFVYYWLQYQVNAIQIPKNTCKYNTGKARKVTKPKYFRNVVSIAYVIQ